MHDPPRILTGTEVLPPLEPAPPRPEQAKGRNGGAKSKASGRFEMLNRFVDFTLCRLGRAETRVWLILFRDCRDDVAATSQADLARRGGMDRKTVYRALRRLQKRGLVQVVRLGGLRQGVSRYRLLALEP
jgi:hypothetical protein